MEMYCTPCLCLFLEQRELTAKSKRHPNSDQYFVHHLDAAELCKSAENGCLFCKLIWQTFSAAEKEEFCLLSTKESALHRGLNPDHFVTYYHIRKAWFGRSSELTLEYSLEVLHEDYEKRVLKTRRVRRDFQIIPAKGIEGIAGFQIFSQGLVTNTLSVGGLLLAMRWVHHCRLYHPSCEPQDIALPTRLLDVGSHSLPSLRLLRGDEIAYNSTYVTLSHRWGLHPILTLKMDNLDAVELTRMMGIRYLWIDSLCIIQDSEEDWKYESRRMGMVYRHGFCNIAATTALDGTQGCFQDRDPVAILPVLLEETGLKPRLLDRISRKLSDYWSGIRHTGFGAAETLFSGSKLFVDPSLWEREVNNSPLGERAWVLQERFLATRILHFGRNQIFFECANLQACETYPVGLPDVMMPTASFKKRSLDAVLYDAAPSERLARALDLWGDLVESYSAAKLTKPTDKLVAISGIVTSLQEVVNTDYIAGVWLTNLTEQLLWYTEDPNEPAPVRQAPSWSWASINSEIRNAIDLPRHPEEERQILAILIHVEAHSPHTSTALTTATVNAGGLRQLDSGNLRMQGRLIRGEITDSGNQHEVRPPSYVDHLLLVGGRKRLAFIYPDVAPTAIQGEVFCLPILMHDDYEDGEEPMELKGLLLQKIGLAKGEYRRCGMWIADAAVFKEFLGRPDEEELGDLEPDCYLKIHADCFNPHEFIIV